MLVLTRKVGESILIDDDKKITIVAVRGNQVKLSFDMPKDVIILREELADKNNK